MLECMGSPAGGGKDLIAAEVVAGERGAEVGGGSGTGVDMFGGRELPTPPAPLKWTYSTVKLSYVRVESSSTAVPCPSSPFIEHYAAPWLRSSIAGERGSASASSTRRRRRTAPRGQSLACLVPSPWY
jgi:hypothetical protein